MMKFRIKPNNSWYYKVRGEIYVKLEEYEQALADYTQAINLQPDEGEYYEKRGQLYHLQGDREKAKIDYLKLLKLEETNLFSLVSLGILSYQENKPEPAQKYFQQALENAQKEKSPSANWHYVAISQLGIGQTETALETYRQAKIDIDIALENLYFLQKSPHPPAGVDEAIKILEIKLKKVDGG